MADWPSRYELNKQKAEAPPKSRPKGKARTPAVFMLPTPKLGAVGGPQQANLPSRTAQRRSDEPVTYGGRGPGALRRDLEDPATRELAVAELKDDIFAPSNKQVVAAKLKTVTKALAFWGFDLYPPTEEKIRALGAALKYCGYRSAPTYLSIYRVHAERAGHDLSGSLKRALADAARSCDRGLGGPAKALPLPFDYLGTVSGDRAPCVREGPIGMRNLVVAGSWFLCREIELSLASVAHVEFDRRGDQVRAHWRLPVSKTDQRGLGVARLHLCSCGNGEPSPACVVHALWDQRLHLQRAFPARFSGPPNEYGLRKPMDDLPLFPTERGLVAPKHAVVDTIREAARQLGVHDATDGSSKVSGAQLEENRCTRVCAAWIGPLVHPAAGPMGIRRGENLRTRRTSRSGRRQSGDS